MDKEYYIKKWLEGTLDEEEKKIFKDSPEYHSLEKLSASMKAFKAPDYDVDVEREKLHLENKGKVISLQWLKPMLRIAAVLVVILGSFFYFYLNVNTSMQTLAGEKADLYLPDSSKVMLNAFTKLSYKEKLWERNRQVELEGEAFFSVAKGSKFDVETSAGTVSVLGTRFNVKNRNNYFEVICYEGLVEVQSSGEVAQLPPGHTFRILNGILDKKDNYSELSPAWLNNESSFQSIPFSQVIEEFERQYDVTVITKDVNMNQLFTGKFVHNYQSLAIQAISIPLNLNYEITDEKQIILTRKGD